MGRIMSLSQFGTYVIASTLAAAPTAFAYNYAASIVYPAVAAAWRNNDAIRDVYYRCWGKFFYLYAVGGGCLIGGSDVLIRVLYDPRYIAAGRYLALLAVTTSTTMVTRSMENVLVATGMTRATVEVNVTRLIWLSAGGALALKWGDPIIFVATIGLMDLPAYVYSAAQMKRLGLVHWGREFSVFLAIGLGFVLGTLANALTRALLPNL
jgi:O-antigen/teichoic acid export membrane protein